MHAVIVASFHPSRLIAPSTRANCPAIFPSLYLDAESRAIGVERRGNGGSLRLTGTKKNRLERYEMLDKLEEES